MTHRAAVITCSDRAFADIYEDRSGPILREGLAGLGFDVAEAVIVPDEPEEIARAIAEALASGARVILTTGGTGVGPRDVTVEVVAPLLTQELPGIAELVRAKGGEKTPKAVLSRGVAGVIGAGVAGADAGPAPVFVFTAPVSRGGARDTLTVLAPLLMHLVGQLDGEGHDLD